ncbi:MAG: cytochrome c [Chloroflexi bacterium]|nr:cytochrome c [Chloroflexota bacterium]
MFRFIVPLVGFGVVVTLGSVLIGVIVLRSPDTHANLWESAREGYDRTPLSIVGSEASQVELAMKASNVPGPSGGLVASAFAASAGDPGRAVYLSQGCATCHGLDARGGPVGPSLASSSLAVVKRMVREGRGGMPIHAETHLGEAALADLAMYLRTIDVTRPKSEEVAALQRLTYDPSVSMDVLLKGKTAIRRSCGACHDQPGPQDILRAFSSDAEAARLLADMVYETNLSLEDARAIAYYMLAILNGADPVKAP